MALTNGEGEHLELELSAPFTPIGADVSDAYPYQEAAFFGNLFAEEAEAYYCIGDDYAIVGRRSIEHLGVRACKGYTDKGVGCPYTQVGLCSAAYSYTLEGIYKDYMCTGEATQSNCRATDRGDRKWLNPITTHRKTL